LCVKNRTKNNSFSAFIIVKQFQIKLMRSQCHTFFRYLPSI